VKIQDVSKWEDLYPGSDIELSPSVQELLQTVPCAKSAEEYIEKYHQVEEKLVNGDQNVYMFAKRLYEICVSVNLETFVDELLGEILRLGGFFYPPLSFRQKPKIVHSFGELTLVSVPDFGIFRTTSGKFIPISEIVGIAVENKTRTEKPGVGQAIGSALSCSLHNYLLCELAMPISVIRARGVHLSFMKVSFSSQFMDTMQYGQFPFHEEGSTALLFPPRPSNKTHVGLNLLEDEGRRTAFTILSAMKRFILNLPTFATINNK